MHDAPDALELVEAVATFLRTQAVAALDGGTSYQARVAARMLEIAVRELREGPRMRLREEASLRGLLGESDLAPEALRAALCQRIASGDMDLQTPGLYTHLWNVALDKLAVDQPDYDTYQRLK
jgi:hypothetical protein